MLESISGLTMHAEREGSINLLRTAPACLLEAYALAKAEHRGPLTFFRKAFDRTADPCLEGRVSRLLAYIEERQGRHGNSEVPPWEDVSLRTLPPGSAPADILGAPMRARGVCMGACRGSWESANKVGEGAPTD